jgi:hypothetical protein
MMLPKEINYADLLQKTGGDYKFEGLVVATFRKTNGAFRVVLENSDGFLHIFDPSQLSPVGKTREFAPKTDDVPSVPKDALPRDGW